MALDANAIWDALKTRLEENTSGFKRVTRVRRADWAPELHPVLMVLDDAGEEVRVSDPDDPAPIWRLTGELVILDVPADPDAPARSLNTLVQSVRDALTRQTTDAANDGPWTFYTDLGGLVRMISIARVEKGTNVAGDEAVARMYLEMETEAL